MILYKHKGEAMSREHMPLKLVGRAKQRICDPFVGGTSTESHVLRQIDVNTQFVLSTLKASSQYDKGDALRCIAFVLTLVAMRGFYPVRCALVSCH